jgi:hypothetical protein
LLVTSARSIAASPDDPLPSTPAAKTHDDRTTVTGRVTAPPPVGVPESLNEAAARSGKLVDSESTAEMLVTIAKDCHKRAFEDIKVALDAALDHAKGFAETRVGSEGAGHGGAMPQNNFLKVLEGTAAEFRAKALEMMKANAITTVEYARELAGTTTAAEFVELSSTQARKQCELILKQASSLRSLGKTITKSSAD